MNRVVIFLTSLILILFSCTPQAASETQEGAPPPTTSTSPISTALQGIDSPEHAPTLTPAPSSTPTSPPEPTVGVTIPQLDGNQPVTIKTIHMIDHKVGWGIGGIQSWEDHILYTLDGGDTWSDQTPPESAIPSVGEGKTATASFLDANTAWVRYLDSTTIWRTDDAGRTWVAGAELDLDIHFPIEIIPRSLQFIDASFGWVMIYLESGMSHDWIALYQTKDGGRSWRQQLHPSESSDLMGCCKTGLFFFDQEFGIVTFGIGPYTAPHFSLTVNGGKSWNFTPLDISQIDEDEAEYTNCEAHSPHIFSRKTLRLGVTCTAYSEPITVKSFLYTSDDGGQNWLIESHPGGSLLFLDQQTGWALSREIFRTTDGGASWSWMASVNWEGQFHFIDENLGWAVARSGEEIALVRTEDGGKTWALVETALAD